MRLIHVKRLTRACQKADAPAAPALALGNTTIAAEILKTFDEDRLVVSPESPFPEML